MRTVNITFQADVTKSGMMSWEKTPIVYTLKEVPADYDVSLIADVISRVLGMVMVRTARLFLDDPITIEQACRCNGGYHVAKEE
jgi:hypothetical protein